MLQTHRPALKFTLLGTLFLTLIILTAAANLWADEGDAGWAGAALRTGIGARALGMGGAYVSLAHGASAIYWNPATLSYHRNREVTFAYSYLPWDRKLAYAGVAVPVEPTAGVGLAWTHAGVGGIVGRDHNGQPTGELTSAENAFCLAFSVKISPYLNVGLGMKYLYYKLVDISATGFGFDVALFSSPIPDLNLGLVVQDVNAKYTWDTEEVWERGTTTYDEFPFNTRFGASYKFFQQQLTIAGNLEKNQEQNIKTHLGAEFSVHPSFIVRAGLNDGTPAFGGSFLKPISETAVHLDYAVFFDSVTDEISHIFGWHFQF
ncbi:MAG: hypothetical protein AMJ92_05915 [candidate division Zixibacteria bacterium SM23_81]|nr:MAG: hypothetical protein AMJ92_05915 [candidate division Zixibacteria bacterium SM23_81]